METYASSRRNKKETKETNFQNQETSGLGAQPYPMSHTEGDLQVVKGDWEADDGN